MLARISLLFIFTLFSSCMIAQPNKESSKKEITSNKIDISRHNDLRKLWFDTNNSSYKEKIAYNAFSPQKGIWNIKVENGSLTEWEIRGRVNSITDKSTALMFTQENLYKMAEQTYNQDAKAIYKSTVIYDQRGYIKEIIKKTNPDVPGYKPTDRGFSIKVLDITY